LFSIQGAFSILQVIPGTSSTANTPFAAASSRNANAFDSDLGFPTDFGERYRLTEEIGSGSFGTVYAAEDKESGEVVAVKVLLSICSHPLPCDIDGVATHPPLSQNTTPQLCIGPNDQ
jgi:hypothetical protein